MSTAQIMLRMDISIYVFKYVSNVGSYNILKTNSTIITIIENCDIK